MKKQEIDKKINNTPLLILLKKLNYKSNLRAKKAIDKFLDSESIYTWLDSGFYDLVYNEEDLFISLCNVLGIDKKEVLEELEKYKKLKKEVDRFKGSFILVNTNFKRKSEPIVVLACLEKDRRLHLYKKEEYLFKSIDEILKKVSTTIAQHYTSNNGYLPIWGKIQNYQLHLFGKIYTFNPKGERIRHLKILKPTKLQ